ncbi:hypothetical protein THAOC_20932, partial [Thalassiosira oceanica]
GAANYPPFKSGTLEGGNVDYTFYTPRVFNGRLHYDHVRECPSEAPSTAPSAVPTVSPWVTTRVSYAFYVEHDPYTVSGAIMYDMSYWTRKVLDKLISGMDPVLTGYAEDDNLKVDSVKTRVMTPREIGYICVPTPPQECLPVFVDVEVRHDKTISTNDVTFALLKTLPRLISKEVTGSKEIEYVVHRAEAVTTRVSGEIIAIYQDTIVVGDYHPKNRISSGSAHVFVRRGGCGLIKPSCRRQTEQHWICSERALRYTRIRLLSARSMVVTTEFSVDQHTSLFEAERSGLIKRSCWRQTEQHTI